MQEWESKRNNLLGVQRGYTDALHKMGTTANNGALPLKTVLNFFFNVWGFPRGSVGKESACNAGAPSAVPGSGRSPGEENGNPLQYSCLENSMDRGVGQATIHGNHRGGRDCVTNFHFQGYFLKIPIEWKTIQFYT